MINLDPIILDFISKNWLALTMLLGLLKGVAKLTPGTHDDKIVTLLVNTLSLARKKNGENKSAKV